MLFLSHFKTRTPKKVLEIGGGSGHISCTLSTMGYDVQSVEPMTNADIFFKATNKIWFGTEEHEVDLINEPLHKSLGQIDFEGIDTIIMVDCLEHILEKDFHLFWMLVNEKFNGRFIVTNVHHPINGGGHTHQEHCRVVDDNLYDEMAGPNWTTWHRFGAHLVLDKIKEK